MPASQPAEVWHIWLTDFVVCRCNLYGGTMGSVNGYTTEASVPQVEAVEFALRRVCLFLLTGTYPAAPCKAKAGDSLGCSKVWPSRCLAESCPGPGRPTIGSSSLVTVVQASCSLWCYCRPPRREA